MKNLKAQIIYGLLLLSGVLFGGCKTNYTTEDHGDYILVKNKGGAIIGYSSGSGVKIIEESGFAFKDLNRNNKLDAYEDWRLPYEERVRDLAKKMSVEQMAGLMLYSAHQAIPARGTGRYGATYGGRQFDESGAAPGDLNDTQKKFLIEDNLRHVLITKVESPGVSAQWSNNAQALVEGIGLGIPINVSSDPRHGSDSYAEFNAGAGGKISMWPSTLGLAASFDPELMRKFGETASVEYRALGIATALSPQIDLGTEPRWSRFDGTMGEDPDLTTDLARAYVDGFQTSDKEHEIVDGWGFQSVNAMVKHWPGGGPEEAGRDAHFGYGAYAVYPGNRFTDHLKPFTEGAFKLNSPTKKASAVMPYYTISYNRDTVNGENVGNSYNKYLITDLLRKKYGYDGVICTDWAITKDVSSVHVFEGKSWGVENMSVAERHYKALEAGVDQFGGNNEMGPVTEAYKMGVNEHGEKYMRRRFEESAIRLLRNFFRTGLFENPYLDVKESEEIVGNPEFMKTGYEAQLLTIVMLKNKNHLLPLKKQKKVYVPERFVPSVTNWFGVTTKEKWEYPFNLEVIEKYFKVVDKPEEADFALVGIHSPDGGAGYDVKDLERGGNGYAPISLQYKKYTADFAREKSIAGGSPFENFKNRSYKGKSVTSSNISDYELVKAVKAKMGDKPVVVVVKVSKPMVFSEIEPFVDGILIHMGVQDQALMDIITGAEEPSALLPFQMPANMQTVEEQCEDVARDMKCYEDSESNIYDFAFGLNWSGIIQDERVTKYK
jgi:beta-glucosidase